MGEVTILGGRAHRLLPYLIDDIGVKHQKGETCLLLVPEQYTLQAEVELIRRLDLPGFFNIQVLSPSRLTQRIFDAAGSDGRTPLDGRGKRMALSRAITKTQKELVYYRRAAAHPGLVEKMSSLIADFKRGRLTADGLLENAAALPNHAFRQKLTDIARCWQAYEEQLAGRFVDGEDVQNEAARRLGQSGLFENAHVYAHGFDILSPQLCQMLCAGASLCTSMTIALTMDAPEARDGALFAPARKSAMRLSKMLEAQGHAVKWTYLPYAPLPAAREIAHLEENLFAHPAKAYPDIPEAISLFAAPNPYAEAHEAASRMIRLHEEGIAWGEMAVAAGSIQAYGSILSAVFTSYGIPIYLEEKSPVSSHGLIRFLLHGLRAISRGYARADILALMKSGYAPMEQEEAYRLENYAIAYGISGERWRKPFTRGSEADIERLEPVRKRLMEPLLDLQAELRRANEADDSLKAIFRLLERVDAYKTLIAEEERLLSLHLAEQAAKTRQVWQFLLGTLDQMHDLLSGQRAPSTQVAAWLEAGFSAGELSALPPAPDTVVCGEIGHVMPGSIKVLFAMGLGDGLLQPDSGSLIRDDEREQLEILTDTHLGLDRGSLDHLARTDLWRTLTLPTQRLFLSHAQASPNGQSQRPAGFLTMLRSRVFPKLIESGGVTGPSGPREPLAQVPALDGLALRLSALWDGVPLEEALPEQWQDAWAYLYNQPETQQKVLSIAGALAQKLEARPLETGTALTLFGHQTMSVSRLEEYAQCPYKHFVHYGLQPVPRKEWTLNNADVGTFFHGALKDFTEKTAQNDAWPEIDRQTCDRMMDEVLSPLEALMKEGPLGENAQTRALSQRYLRTIRRAAWMFTQHIKSSSFRPRFAEVSFGTPDSLLPPIELAMPDGTQVLLRGIIDRVDLFEEGESVYLRVVDYKSGRRELDPTQIYWGLQLQLMLYLQAALNIQKGAEPAGAFYFHIDDPLVDLDTDVKERAEKEIAQLLRLKGVVLSDVAVVQAMDKDMTTMKPVFNKDGSLSAYAFAASLQEMHDLLNLARQNAQKLASAMRAGKIAIAPAKVNAFTACQYCDYAGICRWDARLPGAKPRVLAPLTLEELKERAADLP